MVARTLALRIPHLLAQVEIRLNPALRERAFVVATSRESRAQVLGLSPALGRGGLQPGAPLAAWLRRQPELLVLEGRPERVEALLAGIRLRLEELVPQVRSPRNGLFLLDLRGSGLLHPDERALGRRLLETLQVREGVLAAAGLGSSPLAAQLLARRAGPGELHAVDGAQERRILDDLPLAGLPDLSLSLLAALARGGIRFVGEARALPAEQLERLHGEAGGRLRALLEELDPAAGVAAPERLRARRRLAADSADPARLGDVLLELLEELLGRTREAAGQPRRLLLRLVWNDGQRSLGGRRLRVRDGESRRQSLRRVGRELLGQALAARRLRVRELELELELEAESAQLPLFQENGRAENRERRLDQALGQLRRRWGAQVVRLGPRQADAGPLDAA
ncbi:MAG: hypothetical protein WC326_01110 [Candidatus Delongbacteria bacterium]